MGSAGDEFTEVLDKVRRFFQDSKRGRGKSIDVSCRTLNSMIKVLTLRIVERLPIQGVMAALLTAMLPSKQCSR